MRDRGPGDRERGRHDGHARRRPARQDRGGDVVDFLRAGRGVGDCVCVDDVHRRRRRRRTAAAARGGAMMMMMERQIHPRERIHAQVDNGAGAAVLVQEPGGGIEVRVADDGQGEVGEDALMVPKRGKTSVTNLRVAGR